jgi:signal transduction histidine kinase
MAARPAPEQRELELHRGAAAAAPAHDADRRRSREADFVSIASHELRAPISVVHGIAATLQAHAGELEEQQMNALLGSLVNQTARLRDLADQLLDLSRIGADGMPLRPERFRPRERLDDLLPRFAAERMDDVAVHADPELELEADPIAFERVAANLILNALAYGRPPVEVRAEGGDDFRLVVEDRGSGVAPEFVPRLFDRFSRSDESRRSGAPGTGLGLSIACEYAGAMGGTLAYEAAQPRGARFTLSLPAARS